MERRAVRKKRGGGVLILISILFIYINANADMH